MNHWTKLSVDFANQFDYLDQLYKVYPIIPEGIRQIESKIWNNVKTAFGNDDNINLIKSLLELKLFPVKDSYVAYLRRDKNAIERNPETVNRICGRIRELGLDKIFEKCSEPKETNRQIGPLFRRWLKLKTIGVPLLNSTDFFSSKKNAILDASDKELMTFANSYLNYNRNKGLDFVGRFNGKYVIGEAKFLTDFGGHQNAQFADGIFTVNEELVNATIIAIYDGVCYIKGNNKLYKHMVDHPNQIVLSALLLRDFLYQI